MLWRIFIKLLLRCKKNKLEDSHLTRINQNQKPNLIKSKDNTHIEDADVRTLNKYLFSKTEILKKERYKMFVYMRMMKVFGESFRLCYIYMCLCLYRKVITMHWIQKINYYKKSTPISYCFLYNSFIHLLTPFWQSFHDLLESPVHLSQASSLPFDLCKISVCDAQASHMHSDVNTHSPPHDPPIIEYKNVLKSREARLIRGVEQYIIKRTGFIFFKG